MDLPRPFLQLHYHRSACMAYTAIIYNCEALHNKRTPIYAIKELHPKVDHLESLWQSISSLVRCLTRPFAIIKLLEQDYTEFAIRLIRSSDVKSERGCRWWTRVLRWGRMTNCRMWNYKTRIHSDIPVHLSSPPIWEEYYWIWVITLCQSAQSKIETSFPPQYWRSREDPMTHTHTYC